jgi:hypothetical protein
MDSMALSFAGMPGAELDGSSLVGAHLIGSLLAGASLRDADLYGADLRHSILAGADLTGAVLDEARLDSARYDSSTRFPADFDPVASGLRRWTPSRASNTMAPAWAGQTPRVKAFVELRFRVNRDGEPVDIRVLSGPREHRQEAIRIVKGYRFTPRNDAKEDDLYITQRIPFD